MKKIDDQLIGVEEELYISYDYKATNEKKFQKNECCFKRIIDKETGTNKILWKDNGGNFIKLPGTKYEQLETIYRLIIEIKKSEISKPEKSPF